MATSRMLTPPCSASGLTEIEGGSHRDFNIHARRLAEGHPDLKWPDLPAAIDDVDFEIRMSRYHGN